MAETLKILPASVRVPPQAIEAEQALLGGLLLDNDRWDEILSELQSQDFYNQNHQLIFDAIYALKAEGEAADAVTVSEHLDLENTLDKAGGLSYIGGLANNTPSTANIMTYARIVRERSILRALISAASKISEMAYNPGGHSPKDVLDHAEKLVFEISKNDHRRQRSVMPVQDLVKRSIDRIEELSKSQDPITGLASGFHDLDQKTAGFQRGDLVVIAGRPSMGKTSFAMNIVEYVAIEKKLPVGVFSMEMSGEQLSMRMLSSLGKLNSTRIKSGRLRNEDWPRLTHAADLLASTRIYIDDSGGLNPIDLSSRARRMAAEQEELGLIVVDYLQLMQSTDTSENRATEISGITRALKMLAKELNIPILILSQLNRVVETRQNKIPVMSDLRESGSIEQDADLILFIYRDEVYNPESDQKGKADIHIAKQRNGPIGHVTLTFLGEYTRFENYAPSLDPG